MKDLLDRCCEKCWHSPENPCPDFIECRIRGPLCHDDPKCKEEMERLRNEILYGKKGKYRISVGAATCGKAAGADRILEFLESVKDKWNIEIRTVGCIGMCFAEPIVEVSTPGSNIIMYQHVDVNIMQEILEKHVGAGEVVLEHALAKRQVSGATIKFKGEEKVIPLEDHPFMKKQVRDAFKNCGIIDPENLADYILHDGYLALSKILKEKWPREKVIEEVKKSGLRGRGGAGFPTGRKWEFAYRAKADIKYVICNADEGDPGAFMNRANMEGDPHKVLEGLIIAGYAIGARYGFIYVRAEKPLAAKRMMLAVEQARKYGLLGENILGSGWDFDVFVRLGAGAFVCGEETALMASIEGKRGMPRPRPPYPAQKGLWEYPTNINNVETLAHVPGIILHGAEEFAKVGTDKSKGTKVFCLTGKIKRTGAAEVPLGITLREVIFDIGGGIAGGKKFKAVQIGGPSGGCIPEQYLDTPVDYESLTSLGAIMGSGGMVVMDEDTCMVDVARFFLTFTQAESCGQCVPCREGTKRMLDILEKITQGRGEEKDLEMLEKLAYHVKNTSLCGLGQTAPNPVLTTLRYFRDEYEAHIKERKCPAGVCKQLITYVIDASKCIGCGNCKRVCPVEAITGKLREPHKINPEVCIRCGSCYVVCPVKAIKIEK